MKLIAHRGNISGPIPLLENSQQHILKALEKGFDVETDFWIVAGQPYYGHDEPTHILSAELIFYHKERLWIHAKNLNALVFLMENKSLLNGFYHEKDKYTLTTKGFIWTYPGNLVNSRCVLVHNQVTFSKSLGEPYGICSDYVEPLKENLTSCTIS